MELYVPVGLKFMEVLLIVLKSAFLEGFSGQSQVRARSAELGPRPKFVSEVDANHGEPCTARRLYVPPITGFLLHGPGALLVPYYVTQLRLPLSHIMWIFHELLHYLLQSSSNQT